MRLKQNQMWKKDEDYIRVVELERLAVTYKLQKDPLSSDGEMKYVSKKEFCRLLKGAELLANESFNAPDVLLDDDEDSVEK